MTQAVIFLDKFLKIGEALGLDRKRWKVKNQKTSNILNQAINICVSESNMCTNT